MKVGKLYVDKIIYFKEDNINGLVNGNLVPNMFDLIINNDIIEYNIIPNGIEEWNITEDDDENEDCITYSFLSMTIDDDGNDMIEESILFEVNKKYSVVLAIHIIDADNGIIHENCDRTTIANYPEWKNKYNHCSVNSDLFLAVDIK